MYIVLPTPLIEVEFNLITFENTSCFNLILMLMFFEKHSSVMNSIYSGQELFSYSKLEEY